jgi:DNA-binding LacI/PurR family transcriptional regulator
LAAKVTLKEVAARAEVSYQTVSKVLNNQVQVSEETDARIRKAVEELGYRPNLIARSMRSQRNRLIGYSWEPMPPNQLNPILDQFLQSLAQAADQAGYHLLISPFRPGESWLDAYADLIDTRRVDGFVISSVDYNDPRLHFLQERSFPFVSFGRSNPEWDFPWVEVDGGLGMRMVVEHLLKNQRRRIAIVAWPPESRVGQNRMDGLLEALIAAGLVPQKQWIFRGEGSYENGYRFAFDLLRGPVDQRPDAFIAFNDPMAIGIARAVDDLGLSVGKDVAVTGFDDTPMLQYLPTPLTSVRQPTWEVGKYIMNMLIKIIEGEPVDERHILLAPELIVRRSSQAGA